MASINSNLAFAVFSQALRYVGPLAAYPILTRRLGVDAFAAFSTLVAGGMVAALFVEFGYGLHSVREIAAKGSKGAGSIVGTLCAGRLLTFLATALVLAGINLVGGAHQWWQPYALTLALGLAYGFSASWYFIAIENTRTLALIDLVCTAVTVAAVWILVRSPDDVTAAILSIATPLLVANLYGHHRAVKALGLSLPNLVNLVRSMADSAHFFFFTGFPSITGRWAVIAASISSSPIQIAVFAAADKILTAAVNTTVPISRVLLPRVAKMATDEPASAMRTVHIMLASCGALYIVGSIACIALSEPILQLLFPQSRVSVDTSIFIAQMSIVPIAACIRLLNQVGLVSFRRERVCALISIVVAGVFIPASFWLGAQDYDAMAIVALRITLELSSLAVLLMYFAGLKRSITNP